MDYWRLLPASNNKQVTNKLKIKVMKLTKKQKREIARIAVEKSETLENGLMQVWVDEKGIFSILIGGEYRDNFHTHVATLRVWNEGKPYTQASFIRQLEETF